MLRFRRGGEPSPPVTVSGNDSIPARVGRARPLRIMHIALQGALRWQDVEYGLTADTGGHIKYVNELVEALAARDDIGAVDIVVRAFAGDGFDPVYARVMEQVAPKVRIVRLRGASHGYLSKEKMWREHDALGRSLLDHIDAEGAPDLVHAHYADAGILAARVKAVHGTPFLFTGHSLGAVKRKAYAQTGRANPDRCLDRRIGIENEVIGAADLIVASSRDEAELQYADYRAYDAGRTRIVPPGIDRRPFLGAVGLLEARDLLGRFLADPLKPAVLAVARPVAKKNLAELVHAFGSTPKLREVANLVIVAGNRDRIDGDDEIATNLREILGLIDRYDLHGSVAFPKTHETGQVPGLYHYAAATGGVFVNPALNEPFGLTLLEAASVGLPVVATNRGGPNDIVGRLRCGTLVTPDDRAGLAAATLHLLTDRAAWLTASRNGRERVALYDWDAHAARYVDLARSLTARSRTAEGARPIQLPQAPSRLLATDIDGTLVGCADSLHRFARWQEQQRDMLYGVATGRSLHAALDVLEGEGAPLPPLMIVAVGSEIYWQEPRGPQYRRDERWDAHIAHRWDRLAVDRLVVGLGFKRQPALEQREHKLAYFAEGADAAARVASLRGALREAGLAANVVHSHGRFVDVLPLRANKGLAVAWVAERLGVPSGRIFVAGDSGNDIDMLRLAANPVIVANHRDGIAAMPELRHAYIAGAACAGGIIEGVEHFAERLSA